MMIIINNPSQSIVSPMSNYPWLMINYHVVTHAMVHHHLYQSSIIIFKKKLVKK